MTEKTRADVASFIADTVLGGVRKRVCDYQEVVAVFDNYDEKIRRLEAKCAQQSLTISCLAKELRSNRHS